MVARGVAALVSCPTAESYSGSHRETVRAPTQLGQLGEEHSTVSDGVSGPGAQGHPRDAKTIALAHVSRREGSGYTASSLPLTHTHMHTRTPAPTPVPRSHIFSCQSQSLVVSTKLSPPANSFPTHPRQSPMRCSRCFPPNAKKNILPTPLWLVTGLPAWGDRGRVRQDRSVGLSAASTCSRMPVGLGRGGQPACHSRQTSEGSWSHTGPCCPWGYPQQPQSEGPSHAWWGGGAL